MLSFFQLNAQIIIDNTAPFNNPTWLVDNVLLGGGITTSNHSYQGDSVQIGWFDAINTNLGINSGIVMCTGNVYELSPDSLFPFGPAFNTVTDPDLLAVANSVPPLLPAPFTNSFTVSSINDVAVLEFDFIPTSDSLIFKYVFGSQEYFTFENTQYNDVFGFFLSGPGITGPWTAPATNPNGSVNLAVVPNANPPLPITISSINSVTPINQQYFVPNQGTGLDTIASADGFTTILTARALVQCGETYHIRLAIADGTDGGLSSYVWLDGGSFFSPVLSISDDLGIDSSFMNIACIPSIKLTASGGNGVAYQWFDQNGTIIGVDSSILVGVGNYVVSASTAGCSLFSDTLRVISVSDSLPPTTLNCIWEEDGYMYFDWVHPAGASNSTVYNIMGSQNIGSTYSSIASVSYPIDLYSHPLSSIPANIEFFYITTASTCAQDIISSDTLGSVKLDISSSNVSCWNDSDGRIAIDMTSNVITPFTYILDNVPNPLPYPGDSIFSGLSAGTYSLTITDSASCYINNMITITAPNSPLQALTSGDLGLCHSDSTSISVAYAAGGTAPYSYSWYSSTVGSPSTIISTTDTAFGLTSGVYFAEVTDANGCDTVSSVQVLTPNTSLFSSTQISELICKGDSSGYLVGDAGGGFAPYTYEWSTSLSGIIKTTSGVYNTDTLRNLSADIYLLDITDHFGCKVSQISLTVNEPSQALFLDTIYLIDSIACFGDNDGRALGVVSGGDPFYTYLWDNGESTLLANHLTSGYHTLSVIDYRGCEVLDSIYIPESSEIISSLVVDEMISCYSSVNGVVSVSTVGGHPRYTYSWSNNQPLYTGIVDTAFALSYGVYALTTEDTLGCSVVDSVYLAEPALLTMQAQELSRVSCKGLSDGLAFSTAHGGTLPYTFVWGNSQTGDTVNTLSSGLYTVIVTDARGCIASDTVFIHEPLNSLMVDISVLDFVYCNGVSTGILEANVLGGTPFMGTSSSYTYLWDDALQASQTTAVAINLSEDIYTVIVTDSRGCTATDTEDITNVTNTMILDSAYSDVSCYGSADGSASVFASGGHAPYSYSWVGPSGISLGNVDVINNLSAGTYSVTVSDINNCTRNTSVDIIEPLGILFNISNSSDESCAGACDGLIHIDSLSGGTFPYTALLTNTLNGVVTQHPVQLGNILFVCSAEYTVSLTDDNGCESSVLANNQAIVNSLNVLPTPSISLLNSISCFGASTGELAVSLVDPNYTYLWESLSDPTFNSSSNTISNLSSGDYLVTVQYTDSLGQILTGCDVASLPYTLDDGSEIIITETLHTDVLCHGDNTGAISIFPSPVNTGPYTYAWDPVSLTGATNINLSAGVYSVTVMDNNNCEKSAVFTINEPLVELEVGIDSVGYVLTANPLGGTLPYSYSWRAQGSNVSLQAGVTYNIYSAGTYYVRVTDSNGCVVESDSIKYNTPPPPPPPPTSIDETSKEVVLSIYPNPFNDQTTVSFGREVKLASIRVVDVFGKLIEEYKVVNSDKHILKRENKSSGIYFVEIEVEQKGKSIYKLIIE